MLFDFWFNTLKQSSKKINKTSNIINKKQYERNLLSNFNNKKKMYKKFEITL